MCNLMQPLYGAVPVQVTCSDLVTHWDTYVPPCCRMVQCCRTFIPLSVSLWNGLADPVFDGVGLVGFKSKANAFLIFIGLSCSIPTIVFYYFSLCLLSVYSLVLCALPTSFNNNNNGLYYSAHSSLLLPYCERREQQQPYLLKCRKSLNGGHF